MAGFMSLAEAAAKMAAVGHDVEAAKSKIVATACQMVAGKARSVIGTYEFPWQELAGSTQAERARLGFTPNNPLLRTGDLRGSIEWNADETVGYVGSNSDIAVWQELGTSRGIPPRSFLMLSAIDQAPKIAKMARDVVAAAFAGHGAFASRVEMIFEVLKLLHEAGEKVAEHWQNMTKDEQRGRRR